MKTGNGFGLGLVVIGSIAAHAAQAAPVTLVGGFTSYSGPAWDRLYTFPDGGTLAVTTPFVLDGTTQVDAVPASPLPGEPPGHFTNAGIGAATLDLSTTSGTTAGSVEFWQDIGAKDGVNRVSFAVNTTIDVVVGQEFRFGSFTFTNGGWFGTYPLYDSNGNFIGNYTYPESVFHFRLVTSSNDPRLNGHVFEGDLHLRVTGGTNPTAEEDADVFYFAGFTQLAEVHVYEEYNKPVGASNTGTVDLYGRIGSLIPTRFDNANGVFLTQPGAAVPEPSSWMLLVGAIAAAGASLRKRRRA